MQKQLLKLTYLSVKIFVLFMLFSQFSFSQDIHFSQYANTPALVNPALTGSANVLRASVIYKDQWRGVTVPYKTYGATFEMKFKSSNWEKADANLTKTYKKSFSRLAGGMSFFSDKAGDGNMGTSQVNLSLASFVPLSDKSSLSVGLQASLVQRTVDFSKLIFPYQYTNGNFDPNAFNGETNVSQSITYPDVAAGVNWSYGYNERSIGANNSFKSNIGFSVYHLNQPKQNFLALGSDRLAPRYVLHGDFLIGIENTNLALAPSYLIQFQGPAKEILAGLMCKYYFNEDSKYTGFIKRSAFGLGATYRNKDAIILSTLVEFGQYAIGFSYDVNLSKLTTASTGRGGPEVFLRFVTPNPFLNQMKSRYKLN